MCTMYVYVKMILANESTTFINTLFTIVRIQPHFPPFAWLAKNTLMEFLKR